MSEGMVPVGFLGLGRMGRPMALNLARSGVPVRAWNRTYRVVEDAPAGFELVRTAAEAVGDAAVVLTMLTDLPDVRAALGAVGDDRIGLLSTARPGVVLVLMGTHSPVAVQAWAADLATHGIRVVDAPVSGGDVGAADASLSIMVGGADDDVARVRNLLSAMGSAVHHVGPVGAGQFAKAANQIVVGGTLTALAEAVTLAAHGGIAAAALLEVLSGGLAGSRVIDLKGGKLTSRDFTPGGAATAQLKDLGFALEAGRAAGVALPMTAVVDQLYAALVAAGHGDDDHSAVIRVIEQLSASLVGE